jgi:hypothetical protein
MVSRAWVGRSLFGESMRDLLNQSMEKRFSGVERISAK